MGRKMQTGTTRCTVDLWMNLSLVFVQQNEKKKSEVMGEMSA